MISFRLWWDPILWGKNLCIQYSLSNAFTGFVGSLEISSWRESQERLGMPDVQAPSLATRMWSWSMAGGTSTRKRKQTFQSMTPDLVRPQMTVTVVGRAWPGGKRMGHELASYAICHEPFLNSATADCKATLSRGWDWRRLWGGMSLKRVQ